ncbi:TetR/AcrR family transcriptional regulator [Micromonospora maritima]|uniref:TetR/AcrR family transcriptional regulator n=1 Tax=Micromonospora maritima TaxID=986711 RepID=A0ABW7ZJE7_9ACTN
MARSRSGAAPDTRERILDEALRLFAERGYVGASIRDLAKRLNMTSASLYYHFSSKEDILDQLLAPYLNRINDLLDNAGDMSDPAAQRRFATAVVDALAQIGPRFVATLADPIIIGHLTNRVDASQMPDRIIDVLTRHVDDANRAPARLRAACAVGCIPAGIDAWARANPGQEELDQDTRQILVDAFLAVLATPTRTTGQ